MFEGNHGHNFCDFLQSTGSSRKCNKCITKFDHFCFSFSHIFCDDQFCDLIILQFRIYKKLWFHACYFSSGIQHTFCYLSHKAGLRSTIYQRISAFSNPCTKFPDSISKCRIIPLQSSKINGNIHCNFHLVFFKFPSSETIYLFRVLISELIIELSRLRFNSNFGG